MNHPSTQPVIEVVVKNDGTTTVTTKGFVGNACRLASEFLRTALGTAHDERLTEEFHQVQEQASHHRLPLG